MKKKEYKTTLDFVLKCNFISLEFEPTDNGESFLIRYKEDSTQNSKIAGKVAKEYMNDFFEELEGKLNNNDNTRICALINALTAYQGNNE